MERVDAADLCRKLFSENGDFERILESLRDLGYSKVDCIACLASSGLVSLGDAKGIVHMSRAWQERRLSDDSFHEALDLALHDKDKDEED